MKTHWNTDFHRSVRSNTTEESGGSTATRVGTPGRRAPWRIYGIPSLPPGTDGSETERRRRFFSSWWVSPQIVEAMEDIIVWVYPNEPCRGALFPKAIVHRPCSLKL